jgi:hypothetical protein
LPSRESMCAISFLLSWMCPCARTTAFITFWVHSGWRSVRVSFMQITQQGWFFQMSPVKRSSLP